jgi:hypothetical protein
LASFEKACDRSRLIDPEVAEERKSLPLYRDLSKDRTALICAKYLGDEIVDAKSIAMSMINQGTPKAINDLLELVTSRHALGRAVEHKFARYDEMFWSMPFRSAPPCVCKKQ